MPLNIKIFMWYLLNGVVLTKDNLVMRNWHGSFQSNILAPVLGSTTKPPLPAGGDVLHAAAIAQLLPLLVVAVVAPPPLVVAVVAIVTLSPLPAAADRARCRYRRRRCSLPLPPLVLVVTVIAPPGCAVGSGGDDDATLCAQWGGEERKEAERER
uniref:Uncharacterized protein n=1 Tax=Oryza glumipatula TaxID=40148 RepID=A0A0E0BJQ6_9ORYZ